MTFKEKLQMERPNNLFNGIPEGCPHLYGYEKFDSRPCKGKEKLDIEACTKCWNREMPNTEEFIEPKCTFETEVENAYNKGLEDAWEFMKKCFYSYSAKECEEIFGKVIVEHIVMTYTPQEALAKLKAYEEQSKIRRACIST